MSTSYALSSKCTLILSSRLQQTCKWHLPQVSPPKHLKHPPQHPILQHPHPVFPPHYGRRRFKDVQNNGNRILPLMSRGCGTRSPSLRAEWRLRESHNLLLRRIFGQEGEESNRSLQKIKHIIMTVAILNFSYNVERVTKDRRARRVGMCQVWVRRESILSFVWEIWRTDTNWNTSTYKRR